MVNETQVTPSAGVTTIQQFTPMRKMKRKHYVTPIQEIILLTDMQFFCVSGDTQDVTIGENTGSSGSGDFDSSDKIRPWNGTMNRENW